MKIMKQFLKNHRNLSIWVLLTGIAIVILFFISPDSYINDMSRRVDSSWFYMCGKAWMNGLVPYVDFADSKGPLLWLIYGIGYLLCHTSYHGIFWISCLWYGLTYFYTYKTARIFLPDIRQALTCTVLMTMAFFCPWFHNEIRAEDFALLFMVISLYEMCRLVWTSADENYRYLVLGVCFSALLLIKFNIAAMQAVLILAVLATSLRKQFVRKVLLCALGAVIFLLPFIVYFLVKGNLVAFFQEYFLRTFETASISYVHSDSGILSRAILYLREWYCVLAEPQIGALLLLLVLGGVLFPHCIQKNRYLLLIVSLGVFALNIRHHILYYFTICSPFLLFLFICIIQDSKRKKNMGYIIICAASFLIAISSHYLLINYPAKEQIDSIPSEIIAQTRKATLVNAFDHETGIGTLGEALPAGKYWARQNGSTEQMDAEHRDLILSGKADFVYIRNLENLRQFNLTLEEIKEVGYHNVYADGDNPNTLLLTNLSDL